MRRESALTKIWWAPLDDAGHLALHASVASAVRDHDLHTIAVEGVGRCALIDEDVLLQPLDAHVDGARRGHVGHALVVGQVFLREAVFLARALLDDPLLEEPSEDLERLAPPLLRGAARDRGELLERELVVGELAEEVQDDRCPVGRLCAPRSALSGLLFHSLLSICSARRLMKSMPVSMARSSGAKVAVWVRPAAEPTPRR